MARTTATSTRTGATERVPLRFHGGSIGALGVGTDTQVTRRPVPPPNSSRTFTISVISQSLAVTSRRHCGRDAARLISRCASTVRGHCAPVELIESPLQGCYRSRHCCASGRIAYRRREAIHEISPPRTPASRLGRYGAFGDVARRLDPGLSGRGLCAGLLDLPPPEGTTSSRG